MTKVLPPIAMPSIHDIETATEFLFPMMPSFGEPGWRIWTDQERAEIDRVARQIMYRRIGGSRQH